MSNLTNILLAIQVFNKYFSISNDQENKYSFRKLKNINTFCFAVGQLQDYLQFNKYFISNSTNISFISNNQENKYSIRKLTNIQRSYLSQAPQAALV